MNKVPAYKTWTTDAIVWKILQNAVRLLRDTVGQLPTVTLILNKTTR